MELIEQILEDVPYDKQANLAIKDAAVAAGCLKLQWWRCKPCQRKMRAITTLLHELARLYRALGESEREVEIYNRISAIDLADAVAMRLGKDASPLSQ